MNDKTRYLMTTRAAVWFPLLQALITGLCGFTLGASIAALKGDDWLTIGAISGAVVLSAAWLISLAWWRSLLAPPSPEPPARAASETVRISLLDESSPYTHGQFLTLPTDRARLEKMAVALVDDPTFSMSRFGGAHRLYSRAEFEALREELIRRGLVRWTNPRAPSQGAQLTPPGRAFMRRLVLAEQDASARARA